MQIVQKKLPSINSHSFAYVPRATIPRSQFLREHYWKGTFNCDYLIPFYWDEVLPGDTAPMNFSAIVRMVTPETPFMDNLYITTALFFVPNRIMDDNWQKLMGERRNPTDSIDYVTPKFAAPAVTGFVPPDDWSSPSDAELTAALYDYFGFPTRVPGYNRAHNYLARAYNLIWNEWYRDQNLQNSVPNPTGAGPDNVSDFKLLKRGKRHDYFTSCLPWLQKGDPIDLPLGSNAPIVGIGKINNLFSWGPQSNVRETGGSLANYSNASVIEGSGTEAYKFLVREDPDHPGFPGVYADLTDANAATISSLIQAFALQDLLQTDARGGTRYIEILNAHFGVTAPDYRLQRPEYLGGMTVPFMINPLAQTSETASTELGTLAATATATINKSGFFKSFVEHGWVIGLMSVCSDLTYQQGLHRSLTRSSRYDFYFPAFANLPEQAVLLEEIYCQGTDDDTSVFGYQERWSELRYGKSMIVGRYRSNDPISLDVWHLAQDYSTPPELGPEFIQSSTPLDRVIAVTTEPHFKADIYGAGTWARPMPTYSVPQLMNRF